MKKLLNFLMIGAVSAMLVTTSSCTKTCDAGYEGSDCKTEVRTKYYGNYKTSGTAVNTSGSFTITDLIVSVSSNASDVQNFNFSYTIGGDTYLLNGKIDANGTAFTVPSQTAFGLTYTGTGTFTTSSMTVQLTEVDGGTTTTINLTGPKQ
ncbi:MAG: hypothetical protein JNL95_06045 [Chitinophagales bacterium]|nr:hypothetical protein [Chitinophagales bacterium]